MKVLWCSWKDLAHPLAGGAEVYAHEVTRRLADRGHAVTLACAEAPGAPSDEVVDGVVVRRRGGPLVGAYRAARLHYERTASTWDLVVDEVNTRPFNAPLFTRGTPVLTMCHQIAGEVWHHETPAPVAVLGRFVLEPWWWTRYRDTTVATVSASTAASLAAFGVHDVHVLPQGSTFRSRPGVDRTPYPSLVSVGRVAAMKRPFDLLHAHRLLRRRRPGTRLQFIGDGPDLERLRAAAAPLPGVEVTGRSTDDERDRAVASAWAMVSASTREGWGFVVSEAAAMGTFSVTYRVPGLVDSVTATGGVLCDPHPAALAEALDQHLDRLAAGRPTSTGTADWDVVTDHFERLADTVVAGRRPARADRSGVTVEAAG
jgi:glycosyltransferase involved in cell wall biosynthesis